MKFLHKNSSLLKDEEVIEKGKQLLPYVQHLNSIVADMEYDSLEASINLPSDQSIFNSVKEAYSFTCTKRPKYIIDIGIGGSNLGTKAVYDALFGHYDDLEQDRFPKMLFLDTNDEIYISKLVKFIHNIEDPNDILVTIISKSGGTTETIANAEIVIEALKSITEDYKKRIVIITDEGSKLWENAKANDIVCLGIPKHVGGRFSVLSNVGLFPLYACGVDIKSLQDGALYTRKLCLNEDVLKNPAILSALTLYIHDQEYKRCIHDTFFFNPQLESIGCWYRQLLGESIGKDKDLNGNSVNVGLLPTVSIGSTDLHSVGQLYFGGPKNRTTTFVWTENITEIVNVPDQLTFPLVEHITGKRPSTIMSAIYEGVKITYKNQELPFIEVIFDEINEKSIGEFFQFKMIEMMYLGRLYNVNPFDQPHVELYKVETKKILQNI